MAGRAAPPRPPQARPGGGPWIAAPAHLPGDARGCRGARLRGRDRRPGGRGGAGLAQRVLRVLHRQDGLLPDGQRRAERRVARGGARREGRGRLDRLGAPRHRRLPRVVAAARGVRTGVLHRLRGARGARGRAAPRRISAVRGDVRRARPPRPASNSRSSLRWRRSSRACWCSRSPSWSPTRSRAGRSERLGELAPELSALVVRLLADDETAGSS